MLEKKEARSSQLFRTIVEKSLNEIFLMDLKTQRIIYANKQLLDSFGYDTEELSSKYYDDLIVNDKRNFAQQMLASLLGNENKTIIFQVDCLRSDHSYFPTQINLELIHEERMDYILGVCVDMSSHKRNMDLIEKHKNKTRELQLNNQYKSTYFANLSHEMRTTLNSTLILSKILTENRSGNLKEDQLKYVCAIHQSTASQLSLLNEVLDLSKLESGKMSMQLEFIEVTEFCKDLERLFQPVASEKSIRFKFINDVNCHFPFKTDRLRLEQILKNLISNALKFTNKGSVNLRVFHPYLTSSFENSEDAGNRKISFEVSDSGIGIPEDLQKSIFQSYIQAETGKTTNKIRGTGLGLSISKEIAELLGGSISLRSTLGKGTTFTLELPLDSSASILKNREAGKIKLTKAPEKENRPKPKNNKKCNEKFDGTVLLIDDSETHNMALSEFLSFKITKTITAESAKEALRVLESEKISCIVLDMYLPDSSGKELLMKLKNDDRFSSIPVIIYSGKSFSREEEEELKNLVDTIIQKNVMSYSVLLSKITAVL